MSPISLCSPAGCQERRASLAIVGLAAGQGEEDEGGQLQEVVLLGPD